MMHEENGYIVSVAVYKAHGSWQHTARTVSQEFDAERIALAAAVDALRGPKAEPQEPTVLRRAKAGRKRLMSRLSIRRFK